MTNPISELSLSFVLITNWTGHVVEGKELGYVATNHNLSWTYETNKYIHTMKTVPSEIAAWRKPYRWQATNVFWEGLTVTNRGYFNLPMIPNAYMP